MLKNLLNDDSLNNVVGGFGIDAVASGEILEIAEKMSNMVVSGGLSAKDVKIVSDSSMSLMEAAKSGNYKMAIPAIANSLSKMDDLPKRMELEKWLAQLVHLK